MSEPANGSDQQMRLLDDGNEIPVLGLGVWQVPNGPECVDAVHWALELGYRHVDTAQAYGNEESVGEALRRSGIRREEVFITTKFNPSAKDATRELGHSLERMGVDYVDLYLIHWPRGGATWAWPAMEQAHRLGFARSIGVSNFNVKELQEVMTGAVVPPVVDQVQLSPFHYRRALLHEGQERGLVFEAYSPLGTGRHLDEESVRRIAAVLIERRPRCCCGGACSTIWSCCRNQCTGSGSKRTLTCSTSHSLPTTWPSSTDWTAREERIALSSANGGNADRIVHVVLGGLRVTAGLEMAFSTRCSPKLRCFAAAPLGLKSSLQQTCVEEHSGVELIAVEPRRWRSLRVLCSVRILSLQHPLLISGFTDTRDVVRPGQPHLGTNPQEILVREASTSLWWLLREQRLTEFVEMAHFSSQRQSVVCPHRLGTQEASHAILDGQFSTVVGGCDHSSIEILELLGSRGIGDPRTG